MSQSVMSTYQRMDVGFVSGQGPWLVDERGERYLDALSGIAVCGLGHAHPRIAQVVAEQAARLVHTSNLYRIPLQEKLAQRLTGVAGLERAFFCNSGAEANEAAIKICRKFAHQKRLENPVIVVMDGGFHGRTLSTLSATGNPKAQEGFAPLVAGFHCIPYDDVQALLDLEGGPEQIVAVMLEPVQGENGVVAPRPGYLQALRTICDQNGWLLVLDEVQTGLCRTGAWFAYQHENIRPDIATLAKSLGNGLPIGACLAAGTAADLFTPGSHGSTFGGNPLAAAAALTVIELMDEQKLAARAAELGTIMLARFKAELGGLKEVIEVRGKGLMIGIELARPCAELVARSLERRLLINVAAEKVVRLLPPLIISDAEMNEIVDVVCALIKDFAR